ncbi:MAG: argininosuccinate lyase [Bacteroidales bacterium]|nr:argininosuccinate lyase [Bacteroidales bacterium]
MKLWDKGYSVDKLIEDFTVGKDREMDLFLAKYDVQGSLAHIAMLESIGLITHDEYILLQNGLKEIYGSIEKGQFTIEEGVEDVHSQVEFMLTKKLGDAGKKIHSGRSRNDQVLVDIKLFLRDEVNEIAELVEGFFNRLLELSNTYQTVLMPGYTHFQVAMPSSFGLWFGAYAEALADDMHIVLAAYKIINQNPLGSGAGYGSSFPLNRTKTTELLGFDDMNYNVVYAQMGRGKAEKVMAYAMASIGATLAKLAMDVCLFMSQNFGFVSFPDEYTTGSSIMPHKKNPDVFELVRAKGNKLQALPNEITMMTSNLPVGYHRDMQLLKENLFPAFFDLKMCLTVMDAAFSKIKVNDKIIEDEKYLYLFSVEEVNKLVLEGIPFRDAYRQVADQIENKKFKPDKKVKHTHEGSIGNLCNSEIQSKMNTVIGDFKFHIYQKAIDKLLA